MTPATEEATREHKPRLALTPGSLLSVALTAALSCSLLLFLLARADRLNEPARDPGLDDVPMVIEFEADDGAVSMVRATCDLWAELDGEFAGTMRAKCRT